MDGYQIQTINPQRKRVWSHSDFLELLAWLDHCSRHDINFKETVIEYLKQTIRKEFSSRQIREKLQREWVNHGNCEKFEEIFLRGLAAFLPLDDHDANKVADITNRLNEHQTHRNDYGRTPPGTSTAALDSSPLSEISQPDIQDFFYLPLFPDIPPRSIYSVPPDEPILENRIPFPTRTKAPIPKNATQPTETGRGGRRRGKDAIGNNAAPQRAQSPVLITSSDPNVDLPDHSTLEKQLAKNDSIIAAQNHLLAKQESFILTLQTRTFQMQRKLEDLLGCHYAAENDHERPDIQEHLRRSVSTLKQQTRDKTQLENDLEAIKTSQLGISSSATASKFDEIQGLIVDACRSVELMDITDLASTFKNDSTCNDTGDLWAEKGTSLTLLNLIQHCANNQISSLRLARVLAAAGLCDLVFEPIFPTLLAIDSPILDQYRRQIFTKYGHRELYLVDSLAHKSFMSDGFFKSSAFKGSVAQLQNIFSHYLGWLVPPEHQSPERPTTQLESDEDLSASMADAFKETLKASLKLKTELMVPDTYYRLRFFKPGDVFNAELMNLDATASASPAIKRQRKQSGDFEGRASSSEERITLCIFPAVYSSPPGIKARNIGEESSIQDCVVDYTNFLTSAVESGSQSWSLISKATVLVNNEASSFSSYCS